MTGLEYLLGECSSSFRLEALGDDELVILLPLGRFKDSGRQFPAVGADGVSRKQLLDEVTPGIQRMLAPMSHSTPARIMTSCAPLCPARSSTMRMM